MVSQGFFPYFCAIKRHENDTVFGNGHTGLLGGA